MSTKFNLQAADFVFASVLLLYHQQALDIAARMAESNASLQRDVRISHSVIPEHFMDSRHQEEEQEDLQATRAGGRVVGFMGS